MKSNKGIYLMPLIEDMENIKFIKEHIKIKNIDIFRRGVLDTIMDIKNDKVKDNA